MSANFESQFHAINSLQAHRTARLMRIINVARHRIQQHVWLDGVWANFYADKNQPKFSIKSRQIAKQTRSAIILFKLNQQSRVCNTHSELNNNLASQQYDHQAILYY